MEVNKNNGNVPTEKKISSVSSSISPLPSTSLGAGDSEVKADAVDEQSPSASKTLSIPKFHSLIRMRQKLLKRIQQLEEREVSFDDEAKESFYINNERKLKKALLDIERTLYKHGALLDVDEELQAYHNSAAAVDIAITDTGNELLNQRLSKLITKKSLNKEKTITPSFDELRDIMCEVRAEQGSSSDIPDPDKETEAFLDRLENIAFVTARAHQNFISSQLLENLDLYVPEQERTKCSKLPELSSTMKELLSADASSLPDELFRIEMQTAGKLELESSEGNSTIDEAIDLFIAGDSDCEDEEEQDEQELEHDSGDEEVQIGVDDPIAPCCSSERSSPPEVLEDSQSSPVSKDSSPLLLDFGLEKTRSEHMDTCKVLSKEAFATASSNFVEQTGCGEVGTENTDDEMKAVKRVSEWLQNVEPEKIAVVELRTDEDSRKDGFEARGIKRELSAGDLSKKDPASDFSDDEIECLGIFKCSPSKVTPF
ncbi:hypothetical protein Aduo_002156 [Ancylostoma duodenale]